VGAAVSDQLEPAPQPAELPDWLVEQVKFFLQHTSPGATPHVPEVVLRLGTEAVPLWHAIERKLRRRTKAPPYWGFAWPGGQAVARYVLDRPHLVAGKRVLDLASGSGIVAIAAAKAGAVRVMAHDVDPLAVIAIAMNADANAVAVEASGVDIVREDSGFDLSAIDVVLAGDIFYEHDLAVRATAFLQRCRIAGCAVFLGDPGRAALPKHLLTKRHEYPVPVTAENQYTAAATGNDRDSVLATVWELEAANAAAPLCRVGVVDPLREPRHTEN
jgi:predicted nicotinamide N-methyase